MTRRRLHLVAAVALAAAVLVSGCARIPTSGPIQPGKAGAESAAGQQPVQVFAQPPRKGWTPSQVVAGFFAAMASPASGHAVARSYLTPDIQNGWPNGKDPAVVVYTQDEDFRLEIGRDNTVSVTAAQQATITAKGEYRPSPEGSTMHPVFRLQRVAGEWRIGSLPGNLMLTETDVVTAYTPFDLFFFGKSADVLVPDSIVLSAADQDSWPTDVVRALLAGPTTAVEHGVETAIPKGTVLERAPVLDENGTMTISLGGAASTLSGSPRRRMIAQIAATMMRVDGVSRVSVQTGTALDGPTADADAYRPYEASSVVANLRGYFVRDGRLMSIDTATAEVEKLGGPLGTGAVTVGRPAVSLDARSAASVSTDHRMLSVGPLRTKGRPTLLYQGTRLSAASWDRNGDLWVVDNTSRGPRVLLFTDGKGRPAEVPVTGLSRSTRLDVSAVRVAWDGVRVAFVATGGPAGQLVVGTVARDGKKVTVGALRPVAPSLVDVGDVWWYDHRSLAVAAGEQGSQQVTYVASVDGLSISKASSVGNLSGVAAAYNMPLLVSDRDGEIAISQPDEFSSRPAGRGTSPTYPG
ncbi:MAG: hypothetical protein GEV10_01165 [Streptosporangiales bacterium]|nr:hypothetical protein [Streptosporangiales bacterium]